MLMSRKKLWSVVCPVEEFNDEVGELIEMGSMLCLSVQKLRLRLVLLLDVLFIHDCILNVLLDYFFFRVNQESIA